MARGGGDLRGGRFRSNRGAMTEIRTERLLLRRARPDDVAEMHEVLSDPRAMRYWSTPPHDCVDQTREWLDSMIADVPDERDDFVIEHDGRVIGKVGCWRLPDIGYILHSAYWGRGFATEALAAAIRHVFAAHPIPAITADVDPRNLPSLALLKRLGFRETGRDERTWHVGGEWCDSIYLALRRPESG